MYAQRINITLPYEALKQLRSAVPTGQRSRFIATAISEKLGKKKDKQKAFAESLRANAEFYRREAKEIEEDFKYADAETLKQIS